jgi:hypothetical protein
MRLPSSAKFAFLELKQFEMRSRKTKTPPTVTEWQQALEKR